MSVVRVPFLDLSAMHSDVFSEFRLRQIEPQPGELGPPVHIRARDVARLGEIVESVDFYPTPFGMVTMDRRRVHKGLPPEVLRRLGAETFRPLAIDRWLKEKGP